MYICSWIASSLTKICAIVAIPINFVLVYMYMYVNRILPWSLCWGRHSKNSTSLSLRAPAVTCVTCLPLRCNGSCVEGRHSVRTRIAFKVQCWPHLTRASLTGTVCIYSYSLHLQLHRYMYMCVCSHHRLGHALTAKLTISYYIYTSLLDESVEIDHTTPTCMGG